MKGPILPPSPTDPRLETDPAPGERVFYRHAATGDLGYLVFREGEQRIKYDQPMIDRVVPFRTTDWVPEHDHRPMSRADLARMSFDMDKVLCANLGLHAEAKRDWKHLRDTERIDWMDNGPSGSEPRKRLFRAIMRALANLAK